MDKPKFLYFPVKPFKVNQYFGENPQMYAQFNIKGHNGVDCFATTGEPVFASFDGIAYFETDANQGEGVVLVSNESWPYNDSACEFSTDQTYKKANAKAIFWHLCDEVQYPKWVSPVLTYQRALKQGMPVKAGDLIGYADNSGFSTGTHCHWGLKAIRSGISSNVGDATDEGIGAWANCSPLNGFLGAINPMPYVNDFYAEDSQYILVKYSTLVGVLLQIWNLIKFKK